MQQLQKAEPFRKSVSGEETNKPFCWRKSHYRRKQWQYLRLFVFGHTDYIKNGTMEKIKVNGKEITMMKDTGASLTLISKKLWKQIGQPKLEEKNTGIELYDKHKRERERERERERKI